MTEIKVKPKSMHTWEDCLEYEKTRQEFADEIYEKYYNATDDLIIRRWDYNTPGQDREMQLRDVDVTLYNGDCQMNMINISEKFRTVDYDDMLIEIESYSKPGWGVKDETSIVDLISYITPNNTYIMQAQAIYWLSKIIRDNVTFLKEYMDFKKGDESLFPINLKINNKSYDITLYKAPTYRDEKVAWSYGFCIQWEDIKRLIHKHNEEWDVVKINNKTKNVIEID